MKKLTITMNLGADPFVAPNTDKNTDKNMASVLTSVALMAAVGDPTVERPSTKRWIVRDGLGNQVGTAELS